MQSYWWEQAQCYSYRGAFMRVVVEHAAPRPARGQSIPGADKSLLRGDSQAVVARHHVPVLQGVPTTLVKVTAWLLFLKYNLLLKSHCGLWKKHQLRLLDLMPLCLGLRVSFSGGFSFVSSTCHARYLFQPREAQETLLLRTMALLPSRPLLYKSNSSSSPATTQLAACPRLHSLCATLQDCTRLLL